MTNQEAERIAAELFRIVHGPGDAGGDMALACLNPAIWEGWKQAARAVGTMKRDSWRAGYVNGIRAERERCMAIVEKWKRDYPQDDGHTGALDEIELGGQVYEHEPEKES